MDLIFLLSLASGLIVIIFIIALLKQRNLEVPETPQPRGAPQPRARDGQIPRRAVGARNARARLRAAAANVQEDADEEREEGQNAAEEIELPDGKIGAKKRAKLEAKAERKAHREAEERTREERKKRQEQAEEERLKAAEKEKQEEEQRLEEEKKAKEEKERQEHEEYLQMKAAFSVEEEGYEEGGGEEEQNNLLQEFINYIKGLREACGDVALPYRSVARWVTSFRVGRDVVNDNPRTGRPHVENNTVQLLASLLDVDRRWTARVVDDRGKFIYISQEELEAVAKFVKQRGRVSITELAESSNQLINLNSNLSNVVSVEN
ncbi:DDRGK domain-containing protein 1 [Blattella germanica]|nr:DDRGK domain-containing protein 1 [Blattella germanica]